MLQQTQVARVVPKYDAFLERFPTVASCAAAPAGDVVARGPASATTAGPSTCTGAAVVRRAPRRRAARRPRRAARPARASARTRRGPCSSSPSSATSACSTPTPARVLARVARPAARPARRRPWPTPLVPAGQGWAWNQAVLDLGATVCTRARADVRRVPGRGALRVARGRLAEPDPSTARRHPAAVHASRAPTARAAAASSTPSALGPVAAADVPAVVGWPDDPDRAAPRRRRPSSPTASPSSTTARSPPG